MANTINLAKNYTDLLDEVYKAASVTNDLTSAPELVRAGSQADTIVYPQIKVSGLGDYSRKTGYTDNSVNVDWKESKFNYDRGTKIAVDSMDNEETKNIAFGKASSELIRTQVAPEGDAFTFATLAGKTGVQSKAVDIANGEQLLEELYDATVKMDEEEVPSEGRILYITPTGHKLIMKLDTTKSREILDSFAQIKDVPQKRFYSAITLSPTDGFKATSTGFALNFVAIDPGAVIKFDKHVVSGMIPAEQNPNADADIYKYRKYALVDVFENKVKGIYVSRKTTAVG